MAKTRPIAYKFDADIQRWKTQTDKAIAQQEAMIANLRGMNREGKKTKGGLESLASSAITRFVSVAAVIGLATKAMGDFKAAADGAAESLKTGQDAFTRFVSISGGNQGRFNDLVSTTKTLSKNEGIPLDQAGQIVFDATSLGIPLKETLELGRSRAFASDIGPLLKAGPKLRASLGENVLSGNNNAAIDAIIAAAEQSDVTPEEIADNVIKAGASLSKLLPKEAGAGVDALAALSVASVALSSPEEAAVSIGRFADVLTKGDNKERFKGRRLGDILDELGGLSDDELDEIIGENIRAGKGVNALLKQRAQFGTVSASVEDALSRSGTATDLSEGLIRVSQGSAELSALRGQQRAAAGKSEAEIQPLAVPQLQRTRIGNIIDQFLAQQNTGVVGRFAENLSFGIQDNLLTDPLSLAQNTRSGLLRKGADPQGDVIQKMDELIAEIKGQRADQKSLGRNKLKVEAQ